MSDPVCTCGHARSQHFRATIPFEHYGSCDHCSGPDVKNDCDCKKFTMAAVDDARCADCHHMKLNHLFQSHHEQCLIATCGCPAFKDEPAYHDRFDDILKEMSALHTKKGQDYGAANDPYANVRGSTAFGIDAWVGALVRLNDKIVRLQSFIRNGKLANESVEDSIQDIAVYAVIMRILYEEQYK